MRRVYVGRNKSASLTQQKDVLAAFISAQSRRLLSTMRETKPCVASAAASVGAKFRPAPRDLAALPLVDRSLAPEATLIGKVGAHQAG